MAPNATAAELQKLAERLYGGDLPGMTGDIPAIKADVHEIKQTVGNLAGFYRGVRNAAVIGASVMTIISGLLAVYAFVIK